MLRLKIHLKKLNLKILQQQSLGQNPTPEVFRPDQRTETFRYPHTN